MLLEIILVRWRRQEELSASLQMVSGLELDLWVGLVGQAVVDVAEEFGVNAMALCHFVDGVP